MDIEERIANIEQTVKEKAFEEKIANVERKTLSVTGLVFTYLTIVELVVAKIFIIYKIIQILSH